MNFTVSDGEKYQKVLEIEIPLAEMEVALGAAAKKLSQKVNIPGFRKGHVPRAVLENYLGAEAILEEAADDLLPQAYFQGIQEKELDPVDRPQIEVVQMEKGQPLKFKATVTVKPLFELGEYKGLELVKRVQEVAEADIDADLEQQRQRMAKIVDVEAGEAAMDQDTLTIDFAGYRDEVAFEGGTAENYPLTLGSNTFIPGFEEQLVGAQVGEERELQVTFPEDYQQQELAGQPVVFKVTVKAIKRRVPPEIDQEFIENVSETAETLEQLREEIKTRLTAQNESSAEQFARNDAISKAVEATEIDIPPVMIELTVDDMVQEIQDRIKAQGLSFEQFLEYTEQDLEQLRASYRPQAEMRVKTDLVLDAVAAAEAVAVTEEDIDEQLAKMATTYWQPAEKLREMLEANGRIGDLSASIRTQKAAAVIYDAAQVETITLTKEEVEAAQAAQAVLETMQQNTEAAEIIESDDADEENAPLVEAEISENE